MLEATTGSKSPGGEKIGRGPPTAPPARNSGQAFGAAAACAICMGLSLAPLFLGTFPLFLQPVSREFGWGASVYPQSIMIAGLVGALIGPLIGRFIDTLGVRRVLLPGMAVWAAALFSLSFIGGDIVLLYIVCAIMGVAGACCGPIALAKVVSGWFHQGRGLALSLVLGASPAVATALMLLLTQRLIETYGWKTSYHALAAIVVVIGLPVCYVFLREAPVPAPALARGPVPDGGTPAGPALRSRAFWTVILATMLVAAAANAIVGHFVAWSAEWAISGKTASIALTFFSLAGPLGSLLAGAAADRASHPRTLAFIFAIPLVGAILLFSGGAILAIPALALIGAGFSAASGLVPFFTTRYFGLAQASTIFGVALGLVTLSLGLGPVGLGVARDAMGAYGPAAPVILGCLLLGGVLIATLPSYALVREGRGKGTGM